MTNLEQYAEKEMRLAGLYGKDSDYNGMIPRAVMAMVKAHSAQGHSGGSHEITMAIFNKVIEFKPLTPLTDDTSEWMKTMEDGLWQSLRDPSCFSEDGGKNYYNVADEKREKKEAVKHGS